MMEYRSKTSGTILTEIGLKNLYPDYSFPSPIPDSVLADFQLDIVYPSDPPIVGSDQTVVRAGASFNLTNNRWEYAWRIVNQSLITFNTIVANGKAALIKRIDGDVDTIYAAVLGNRGLEYAQAEQEANMYKTAGYSGDIPPMVSAWADATHHTAQWAADDILATATMWRNAQSQIRAKRLYYKELTRSSVGVESLMAITEEWEYFYSQMLKQLAGYL